MKLVATADEASESVGTPRDPEDEDSFLDIAEACLDHGSACIEVDDRRLCVLPRMHTSQGGLTARSLSLYLSLCDASEVTPQWLATPFLQYESLNLLLIPWPVEVLVRQFRDVTDSASTKLPDELGFFTCDFAEATVDLTRLSHPERVFGSDELYLVCLQHEYSEKA